MKPGIMGNRIGSETKCAILGLALSRLSPMNAPHPKRLLAGMSLAAVCFAASVLFPMAAPELAIVSKVMIVLGALAVALPTFQWGSALGYRVQSDDGILQLGPILRCTTMTVILGFVSAALATVVVGLCRAALK
jgi:hypothetical protein